MEFSEHLHDILLDENPRVLLEGNGEAIKARGLVTIHLI